MNTRISEHATRYLRAYPTGDHWKGQTVPQIRLQGKWLEAAGISPGDRLAVEIQDEGQLLIRRLEDTV
jgi:hypothetical protein